MRTDSGGRAPSQDAVAAFNSQQERRQSDKGREEEVRGPGREEMVSGQHEGPPRLLNDGHIREYFLAPCSLCQIFISKSARLTEAPALFTLPWRGSCHSTRQSVCSVSPQHTRFPSPN